MSRGMWNEYSYVYVSPCVFNYSLREFYYDLTSGAPDRGVEARLSRHDPSFLHCHVIIAVL